MKIEERVWDGGGTILKPKGAITLGGGVEELERRVEDLLVNKRRMILLDLQDCPQIDAVGLGAITRSYAMAHRHRGELRLLKASQQVKDLLAVTKLRDVIPVFEEEAEAIASFGPKQVKAS